MNVYLGNIGVRAHLEGDAQAVASVVRAGRGHVKHILHPIDFCFERRGHAVRHHLGVGPGVGGLDADFRRGNGRVLGDRNIEQGKHPGQGDNNRNHNSQSWPVDEDLRKHRLLSGLSVFSDCFNNLSGAYFLNALDDEGFSCHESGFHYPVCVDNRPCDDTP